MQVELLPLACGLEKSVRGYTAPLAYFKRAREIRMVEDFPRATLGKIAKAELRQRLAEE